MRWFHTPATPDNPHPRHPTSAEYDRPSNPRGQSLAGYPGVSPVPGVVPEVDEPPLPHISPLSTLAAQLRGHPPSPLGQVSPEAAAAVARAAGQHLPGGEPRAEQIWAPLPEEEYDNLEEDYEGPLTWREKLQENQEIISTFIAGGLAGATSRTAVAPLERLKIILQVQSATPASGAGGQAYGAVWPSLVRMWKDEGFAGFMKGNGINVVRILPYSALQFTSYGMFKRWAQEWSGPDEPIAVPLRLASGAGAGIVAVSATYPLDLVRARLSIATANMASSSKHGFTSEDAKLGIAGMTKKVYRTEGGIRGLYRGAWATAVGVAPYVSLNFFGYESMKNIIMPPELEMGDTEFAARKLLCGGLAGAISLLFTHPFDVLRRKMQVSGLGGEKGLGAIGTLREMVSEGFWKGMYRGLVPNFVKIVPSMAVSFYTFDTVHDLLAEWANDEDDESYEA
ncbi:hypothetical protein CcaverHIS002_0504040 [Cutaneotrichosporon cavernicola]|uniref:Mitochondrial carrier n=1 Tax=Cutaneotrichosporon cavernicola TaxID=279322 RepID=A0AA48L6H9_9TREE|nr:uncharacterized protein CcaverHIS019_0504590 [Cutaneotrichosporon cavernicola]BEI85003.1 hypothetical protein CcaverHIS002_0504040 [Cutaneotrichosporon cavernicola]BEI92831.1 hypothetical protein CcaverHIS019_0504590 [Cutaneotrichosporon cavernicola]BEJ00607.1 hypothetical protein CcaverHIS631_0504640 [Cutaneotrichosporon cavernicola]BEJ08374.1 hypothetical protein CcaverHIS641_0504590 [Cutaneotrichosporon cavernicola]